MSHFYRVLDKETDVVCWTNIETFFYKVKDVSEEQAADKDENKITK